jgi:photosystem II stability/assembly factor-like uncharacterized protein
MTDGSKQWSLEGDVEVKRKVRSPVSLLSVAVPVLIIGGLLYAAFFVKPQAHGSSVQPATIEQRDIFYGVSMPTPDVVWAAGQHGKIIRSQDRGLSWARQISGTEIHLQAIAPWDGERAVVAGNASMILTTSDAGKNWRKASLPEGVGVSKLMRVRAFSAGDAWVVGEFGVILNTKDYGVTWRSNSTGEDITWNDVAFVGSSGWIVGEFGRIRTTVDGGLTWKEATSPIKSSLNAVSFRDGLNGVAVGTGGAVLVTSDGGTTWKLVPSFADQHIFDVLWDGDRWLIAGNRGLLFSAEAEAQVWTDISGSSGTTWHTQIDGKNGRYMMAGYGVTSVDLVADKQANGVKK